MALSQRQQTNIERVWELEAEKDANLLRMAATLKDLKAARVGLQAEIEELEDQVPKSVQDTWDKEDDAHRALIWAGGRQQWVEAYDFIKKLLGGR